jgi:5-methylcytosine-specific restriction endonuclease McrA
VFLGYNSGLTVCKTLAMQRTFQGVSATYLGGYTVPDHTPNTPQTKVCTKCHRELPATPEYFVRTNSTKDGLHTRCKQCKQSQNREWWAENTEEINQRRREAYPKYRQRYIEYHRRWRIEKRDKYIAGKRRWYQENRERDLASSREWRLSHPEYKRQYDKEYSMRNRERIRARQRKWEAENRERIKEQKRIKYAENPEPRRVGEVRRDARKRSLPDTLTVQDWRNCLDWFGCQCAVCGSSKQLHADHWVPLNNPNCPGTIPTNIVPLCKSCNCSKQDTEPTEWLIWKLGIEQGLFILCRIEEYFEEVSHG